MLNPKIPLLNRLPHKISVIFTYRIFCPRLAETFLRASGSMPSRPGFTAILYRRNLDFTKGTGPKSKGLLVSQGTEWQKFRSKVQQPMLKPQVTWRYTPDLEIIALEFIDSFIRARRDPTTCQVADDFIDDLYKVK